MRSRSATLISYGTRPRRPRAWAKRSVASTSIRTSAPRESSRDLAWSLRRWFRRQLRRLFRRLFRLSLRDEQAQGNPDHRHARRRHAGVLVAGEVLPRADVDGADLSDEREPQGGVAVARDAVVAAAGAHVEAPVDEQVG